MTDETDEQRKENKNKVKTGAQN